MRRSTLPAALLLLAACGGEGTDAGAAASGPATWGLELQHEIGSIDDPTQTLTRIQDVALGPDGRLYIGQPDDGYVRVHAEDGSVDGTIGRRGEGPGEFGDVGSIAVDPEGLWVADGGNNRMHRFALDGTFIEDERWPSVNVNDDPAMYIYNASMNMRRAADGRGLMNPGIAVRAAQGGPRVELGPTPIRWFAAEGELGDTVVAIDRTVQSVPEPGWYPGLTTSTLVRVLRDASGVVWVVRDPATASEQGFQVLRVDAAGDTLFARRYSYEPVPTSAAEIRAEVRAGFSEMLRERVGDQIWVPETYPPVSQVATTSSGHLWLAREEGQDPTVWWVLDAETGDHLATLELPDGELVLEALGDQLVTRRTDDFDVEYIRRYRIVR